MGSVDPSRDSEWLRAGRYLTKLVGFTFGKKRSGIDYALLRFQVLAILDDSEAHNPACVGGPHRPGDLTSWMFHGDKDVAKPSLKAALMKITGLPAEAVDDAAVEQLASSSQPLAGLFVEVDGRMAVAQKTGMPYTLNKIKRVVDPQEVKDLVPATMLHSLGIDIEAEIARAKS
jgi:hypothetical protein